MSNEFALRNLADKGYIIRAYCANAPACRHDAVLSLPYLVQRLGWEFDDFPSPHFRYRLICSNCATRHPQLIFSIPSPAPGTAAVLHPPFVMSTAESMARSLEHRRIAALRDAELGHPPPKGKRPRRR